MANNVANVNVAVTGAVSVAPEGTTAPTTAISALDAAFKTVGYITQDGVTESRERSVSNIVAWQNSDVVRTVITEASIKLMFGMLETNADSVKLFYGSAVSGVDGSVQIVPGQTGGRQSFVVDYVDGSSLVRLYIPHGEVVEVDDVVLTSGDAVVYSVTIQAFPDATSGYSAKKWFTALDTTP